MNSLYPFFMAFGMIFVSELGDKTQLLVLSFSSKLKSCSILIGVALGSFFSHGIAILFGSTIGNLNNPIFHTVLQFITYISFLLFGIFSLLQRGEEDCESSKKQNLLSRISRLPIGYVLIIACSIAIGELGDKTFLASLGLGISYPNAKLFLILGCVLGMVVSDSIAILFGKWLGHKLSNNTMNILSGALFLIFGIIGFISLFVEIL